MTTTPIGADAPIDAPPVAVNGMCSVRGAIGALLLLLALPITAAVQVVAPENGEVVIHGVLAIGTFLIGQSVFDFRMPRWLNLTAWLAATVLAAIFLAQGLAAVTQNELLHNVAYSREIGGWGEGLTLSIVMLWFMGVATTLHRGLTKWFGVVSAGAVAGLSLWALVAGPASGTPEALRLLFLLPIGWYLYVSTRGVRPQT